MFVSSFLNYLTEIFLVELIILQMTIRCLQNALIEIICGVMGKKCRIWNVSPGLIGLLAKVGNVLHLPLNTQRLAKLTESYVVSNQKDKKRRWVVDRLPIDSKAGLEKTIRSFIKH